MPAVLRPSVRRKISRRSSRPCSPSWGKVFAPRATGPTSPSSMGIACSRSSRTARCDSSPAAASISRARSRKSSPISPPKRSTRWCSTARSPRSVRTDVRHSTRFRIARKRRARSSWLKPSAHHRRFSCVSIFSTSQASICAKRRTKIGTAISRNACCLRGTFNSCTPRTMRKQLYSAARRRADSKASSASATTVRICRASARTTGARSKRGKASISSSADTPRARATVKRWVPCCSAIGKAPSSGTRGMPARASMERCITDLLARFKELARKDSPYAEKPTLHRPTSWVEPKLVVEVTFARWTPDGLLREPVFIRVRDDLRSRSITAKRVKQGGPKETEPVTGTKPTTKATRTPTNEIEDILQQLAGDAKQLTLDIGGAKLPLSSLDRVYWPADPRFKQPRDHQAGLHSVPRGGVALHADAPEGPTAHDDPHAHRHRWRALLPEALGRELPRFRADDERVLRAQGRSARLHLGE